MKNYRKAVFVPAYYIDKDNKIYYLLLKRKLHWKGYEFCKGGIEGKETNIKTVKREIFEETGQNPIIIIDHKLHGKYKYPKKLKDRPGIIGQTYHVFSARLRNKNVKIDKLEHSSYIWITYEKAYKKLTYNEQKKSLKYVNKCLISKLKNEKLA